MPLELPGVIEPVSPIERGLSDLWTRTATPMSADQRQTFRTAVELMLDSWLWELDNQHQNRVPDPVDYIEMRRLTFGSPLTLSLSRFSHGQTVPAEIYGTRTIQNMENSAIDYSCMVNDVFSYRKEIQYEGEVHNAVLVVQNFLDCDQDQAFGIVNDLMTGRMHQFEHTVDIELPQLFEDYDLDAEARATLTRYAQELKDWMSGIVNWHRGCRRYDEDEVQYRPAPALPGSGAVAGSTTPVRFGGATGLGTSAARLGTLRRTVVPMPKPAPEPAPEPASPAAGRRWGAVPALRRAP
jgi:germacradienol/geosmin synthase